MKALFSFFVALTLCVSVQAATLRWSPGGSTDTVVRTVTFQWCGDPHYSGNIGIDYHWLAYYGNQIDSSTYLATVTNGVITSGATRVITLRGTDVGANNSYTNGDRITWAVYSVYAFNDASRTPQSGGLGVDTLSVIDPGPINGITINENITCQIFVGTYVPPGNPNKGALAFQFHTDGNGSHTFAVKVKHTDGTETTVQTASSVVGTVLNNVYTPQVALVPGDSLEYIIDGKIAGTQIQPRDFTIPTEQTGAVVTLPSFKLSTVDDPQSTANNPTPVASSNGGGNTTTTTTTPNDTSSHTIVNNGGTTASGTSQGITNQDIYEDVKAANNDSNFSQQGASFDAITKVDSIVSDSDHSVDDMKTAYESLKTSRTALGGKGDAVVTSLQGGHFSPPTIGSSDLSWSISLPLLPTATLSLEQYADYIATLRGILLCVLTWMFLITSYETIVKAFN